MKRVIFCIVIILILAVAYVMIESNPEITGAAVDKVKNKDKTTTDTSNDTSDETTTDTTKPTGSTNKCLSPKTALVFINQKNCERIFNSSCELKGQVEVRCP
jgi:hypothetical protein